MISNQVIYIINVGCCTFLALTLIILMSTVHKKNGLGYMALVSVCAALPVYTLNLIRIFNVNILLFDLLLCIAMTLNAMCFPFMYYFVQSQYDKSFRFTPRLLLHLLPAVVSLAITFFYYQPLTPEEVNAERLHLQSGGKNIPSIVNDVIVFGQFFVYFFMIFVYLRRKKIYVLRHYADSDYAALLWIPRFLLVYFTVFLITFVAYIINPHLYLWLIPILDTILVAYLIYCAIIHVESVSIGRTVEIPIDDKDETDEVLPESAEESTLSVNDENTKCNLEEMKLICERVIRYCQENRAFLQSDLTLSSLAQDCDIASRTLSSAINGYLEKNFFEFINEMRVEEAKKLLLSLQTSGYSIDSIYSQCGFRSRSTFFLVFKKVVGMTPAAWLKLQR